MELPTFIVILFLSKGTVYTHVKPAPSWEACVELLPKVPALLKHQVKESVQFYSASCQRLEPVVKET